jgi:hypothetical protein
MIARGFLATTAPTRPYPRTKPRLASNMDAGGGRVESDDIVKDTSANHHFYLSNERIKWIHSSNIISFVVPENGVLKFGKGGSSIC